MNHSLLQPEVRHMGMALRLAEQAAEEGEVPVGAVIVQDDLVIGRAYNQTQTLKDPTAHAEMIAITQAASALGDWRLLDTTLYVTKEPCPMCAGAIVLARIPRVVWAVNDPQRGGAISVFDILQNDAMNHRPEISTGVLEDPCRDLLRGFFRSRRATQAGQRGEGHTGEPVPPEQAPQGPGRDPGPEDPDPKG
jgi:tRNA(adenine34) deaminase